MRRRYKQSCILMLAVLALSSCSEDRRDNAGLHLEGATMGTAYNVTISQPGDLSRDILQQEFRSALSDINQSMSTYIEDSELSRINRSRSTDWIPVPGELHAVLSRAMEISFLTGGAFDITVGPLVNLWGFGPENGDGGDRRVPSDEAISEVLAKTGFRKLQLGMKRPEVRKTEPDLYLDLSGMAKGYAVDRLAAILEELGIEDYMVEIGGEIQTRGTNPQGRAWRIGIEKPASEGSTVQRAVRMQDKALATSGDYRNYFEADGRRYSHIIDPRTGRPVSHALASVSVIDDSAMVADALATALLVMGPEEGRAFAERTDTPAFFILRSDNSDDGLVERPTESFRRYLAD